MDVLSASGDNKIAWYANCVDFGDLPTAYNLTTLSDDGARHNIGDIYLGTQIDSETNGQESADAGRTATDGDNGNGTNDEDGIAVNGDWYDGTNGGAVDVTVTGSSGYLSAWIDWDENNNFTDGGDQVLNMKSVNVGAQTVQFDIPAGAIPDDDTYNRFARLRLVPDNGTALTLTGLFNNGEVEDYYLQFTGICGASISNFVFNDTNADGKQPSGLVDHDETGLDGVTVKLFDSPGNTLQDTKVTVDGGYYSFDCLAAGDYYLEFTLLPDRSFSPKDEGDDDSKDSDVNIITGRTDVFTLAAGADDDTRDVGMFPDQDGDRIRDADDPHPADADPQGRFYNEANGQVLAGGSITVEAVPGFGGSNAEINLIKNGVDGEYQWTVNAAGLPGRYRMTVTPPSGFSASTSCTDQGVYDVDPQPPVYIEIGQGETGGSVTPNDCGSNPFYLTFDLASGDEIVIYNNLPFYQQQQPTNIVLSSFTAVVENKTVILNWITETEPDNAGFNVFRSQHETNDYLQINSSLIPAMGDAFSGATYEYTDQLSDFGTYYYKLQSISLQDIRSFHGPITVAATSVDLKKKIVPENYYLSQNYPNPFNPETIIEFGLPTPGFAEISIYDFSGKLVRTLVADEKRAGNHWIIWDAKDNSGNKVVSGLYFYYFKAGDPAKSGTGFGKTLKMILMK